MDVKQMKNMVVLKNLPSNIIEEAFVVLKENVKVHNWEAVDNKKKKVKTKNTNEGNFAIKEAEYILQDYIEKIEIKDTLKNKKSMNIINKKYERLKALTIFLGMFSFILVILNLIK